MPSRLVTVDKEIGSLNRTVRHKFSHWLAETVWGFDNDRAKYTHDIPGNPSPANPRCYDHLIRGAGEYVSGPC